MPIICEDIMRAQNNPNNCALQYSSETWLVYDPCATHNIADELPQIIAPIITKAQTSSCGTLASVTTKNPVDSKIAYPKLAKNMDFLYPIFLTTKEENNELIANAP